MSANSEPISLLNFSEQELEPPADHREMIKQANRLLARLLVRAWLEERKRLDSKPTQIVC